MKNNLLLLIGLLFGIVLNAQSVTSSDKFNLPGTVSETSGLLYYNNTLITHNDSGNAAELYEINTTNGSILRTVTISNATNTDWEDIAQDDTYIYIGDIGNNNGNRTDLKFYRVLKSDFESNTSVTADVINYSYEGQTDFTSNPQNNNWDAEAFIVYEDYILIFSKNWANNEVDVYAVPKKLGTYSANKVSNYNSQGLVTGADLVGTNKIYLSGYSIATNLTPFLIEIYNLNISTPLNIDVFANSDVVKSDGFLPFGNQVEGICFVETNGSTDTLFISNEEFSVTTPISITFPAKLRELTVDNATLSSESILQKSSIQVYPNPFLNRIQFNKKVEDIKIYNSLGACVLNKKASDFIDTSTLSSGIYMISLKHENLITSKKIIKQANR